MIKQIITLILAVTPLFVSASSQPIPMPGDTKLVTFSFDPNATYTILTRPRNITDITLHPGEELVAMALGDTVQWIVSDVPGHVFIKPLHPDTVTSGTLVTSKRTYQLSLRSSPEDGKFYQRVSWNYPELVVLRQQEAAKVKASIDLDRAKLDSTIVSRGVAVDALNFEYTIQGEADWTPAQVFDDGKFTWVRLRKTQDMPAVFALNASGDAELVNTNIRGEYIVIQRILPKLLLKLGKAEVVIINSKLAPKSGWPWGG